MKYQLKVNSIALQAQSIEWKHQKFLAGLEGLPAPWGVRESVSAPDPGTELIAVLNVAKLLGKGLRGELVYQFRRQFSDESSQDDWINIIFNPGKIDYHALIYDAFLIYVSAFSAYYAEISDEEFIFMDFEHRKYNRRHAIYRIPPVCYMNKDFCARAFDLSPAQIVEKLRGTVEEVREVQNGVFIVLTSKVLPTAEMDVLCWQAKNQLLHGNPDPNP